MLRGIGIAPLRVAVRPLRRGVHVEAKLKELNLVLPNAAPPAGALTSCARRRRDRRRIDLRDLTCALALPLSP